MLKIIGMVVFSAAFIFSLLTIVSYLKAIYGGGEAEKNSGKKYHQIILYLLAVAGILLFYGIVTHDFSLNYVAKYSSTKEEWYYLISTFWAGQEGTFYLWLLYTVIFGRFISKQSHDFVPYVMIILHLTVFFLLLILLKQSPFRPLDPEIFMALEDGRGLNPLLKNPWMVIHPPTLFLGYSSVIVTAAYAIAGLWKRDYTGWIKHCFPWTLFTSAFLGLGVIMGGYWAYVVLGWGGYWAWDPVENASIFPWFILVACFHGMLIFKSAKAFLKTTIVLGILGYFLMLYGSFLTRSGVLQNFSVHSFSSLGLNTELIIFIASFVFLSLYFIVTRWREIKSEKLADLLSKEMILAFVVVIFILATFGIFMGTSKPLFTYFSEQQLASAEPATYNHIFSYVSIFILLFLGLGPILKWKKSGANASAVSIAALALAGIVSVVPIVLIRNDLPIRYYVMFGLSIWALAVNMYNLSRFYSSVPLRASSLTHVGLALMFFGIFASSILGDDHRLRLNKDETTTLHGIDLVYKRVLKPSEETSIYQIEGTHTSGDAFTANLVFAYSDYNGGVMRHPHIERLLYQDLYFSPVNLTEYPVGVRRTMKKGESFQQDNLGVEFLGFTVLQMNAAENVFEIQGNFNITRDGKTELVKAVYKKTSAAITSEPVTNENLDFSFKILSVNATEKSVDFVYGKMNEQLVLEQLEIEFSEKPLIYVLWLGTVILVLGLLQAVFYRRSLVLKKG